MFENKAIAIAKLSAAVALLTLAFQGLASATPNCSACGLFPHVPELDPYTIGAALTVCGGGAALIIERYRRWKH